MFVLASGASAWIRDDRVKGGSWSNRTRAAGATRDGLGTLTVAATVRLEKQISVASDVFAEADLALLNER